MFKALGIILIAISLGLFSYKKVDIKKQQLFNLSEIKRALAILKNELSFSMPEMSFLCKKVAEDTVGEISSLFNSIEKNLKKDSTMDFLNAWQNETLKNKLFSDEAQKEILGFCNNFGKKTIDIELENINKTEKNLEILLKDEKDKYQKDKKLIYTLGAAIGAVVVIIVI